ncbi:hypothetical protein DL93DRAFT_2090561, partial [Clavulina sp. PMI_390]
MDTDLPSYSETDTDLERSSRPLQEPYVYYTLFHNGSPVPIRQVFDLKERSLGRIRRIDISPPRTLAFVKQSICHFEKLEVSSVKELYLEGEDGPLSDERRISFEASSPGMSAASPISVILLETTTSTEPSDLVERLLAQGHNEDIVIERRAKFFTFTGTTWNDPRSGFVQILRNQTTGQSRVLMRQKHTNAILTAHDVNSSTDLQPIKESARSWYWCVDIDHAAPQQSQAERKIAMRFTSQE